MLLEIERTKEKINTIVSEVKFLHSPKEKKEKEVSSYFKFISEKISSDLELNIKLLIQSYRYKKTREQIYTWSRYVIIYDLMVKYNSTVQSIGKLLNMYHSSVIHARKRVINYIEESKKYKLHGKPQDLVMKWYFNYQENEKATN